MNEKLHKVTATVASVDKNSLTRNFDRIAYVLYQNNRMLSPGTNMCSRGTHSCGHMQKVRVHLERADVVIWNTPRTHTQIIHLKHSCVHSQHAAWGLIKRMRVSEPQTHMRARGIHSK